jgi:hypothetical protein
MPTEKPDWSSDGRLDQCELLHQASDFVFRFGRTRSGSSVAARAWPTLSQICEVGQAIEQPKGLQGGGIDADPDAGIAGLDPLEGGSGREGSTGDDAASAADAACVHPVCRLRASGGRGGHWQKDCEG